MTTASGLDALLPPEMAHRAEEIGAAKVSMDAGRLVVLAVLAGAFIAFGAIFSTVALAGVAGAPWGLTRVLAGFVMTIVTYFGHSRAVFVPDVPRHDLQVVPRFVSGEGTFVQVASGLNCFICFAIAAVFGPRSFWYTTPW